MPPRFLRGATAPSTPPEPASNRIVTNRDKYPEVDTPRPMPGCPGKCAPHNVACYYDEGHPIPVHRCYPACLSANFQIGFRRSQTETIGQHGRQ